MAARLIQPVIMAGGSGTRLWPVSRLERPKQFQRLIGERTMMQETVRRLAGSHGDVAFAPPIIIGAERFSGIIEEQLAEIGVTPLQLILEPCARNTAAVGAIAAMATLELHGTEASAMLLPSDHYIASPGGFRDAVTEAAVQSEQGWITTFGIAATSPETGYGYIRRGEPLSGRCYKVEAFVEKPDEATARAYLADGRYSWNAGIFLFSPATMLEEMKAHAGDIAAQSEKAFRAARAEGHLLHLDAEEFAKCRADSIDYAVMEKTGRAAVYDSLDCGWSDIGCWDVLADFDEEEDGENVVRLDAENCFLRSDDGTLVAAIGVSDLTVIAHDGVVLVMPKGRSQDVKKVVDMVRQQAREDKL